MSIHADLVSELLAHRPQSSQAARERLAQIDPEITPEIANILLRCGDRNAWLGVVACFATVGLVVTVLSARESWVGRSGMGPVDAVMITGVVLFGILLYSRFEARSQLARKAIACLPGNGAIPALAATLPRTANEEWKLSSEGGAAVRALARRISQLGPKEGGLFAGPLQLQLSRRLIHRYPALHHLPATVELGLATINAMSRLGGDPEARRSLRKLLERPAKDTAQATIQEAIRRL